MPPGGDTYGFFLHPLPFRRGVDGGTLVSPHNRRGLTPGT